MKSYVIIAALSGLLSIDGQQAGTGAASGTGTGGTAAPGSSPAAGGIGSPTAPRPGVIAAPSAPAPLTPSAINQAPGLTPPGVNGGPTITSPGIPPANRAGAPTAADGRSAPIPFTTLPASVQNTLRAQGGQSSLGTVSQVMTPNGPVFVTTLLRNGVPTVVAIQPNGRMVNANTLRAADGSPIMTTLGAGSRTPGGNVAGIPAAAGVTAPTPPGTATASGLASAQAGLPVSSLPLPVQNALRTRLEANAVQTVSRDDTANGPLFRITALQNGVPTELQFAANGTLLRQTPLNDSLTSPTGAGGIVGTVPPAAVVVDDDSPAAGAAPGQQSGRNFQLQGQGNITPNSRTNLTLPPATGTNRTSRLELDDLPDPVAATLREEAPYAEVRFINQDERPGGTVYRVGLRQDNRPSELLIDENGTIIREKRDTSPKIIARDLSVEHERGLEFATLPVAIKQTIEAYAEPGEVRSIQLTRDRDGKTVYDVVMYEDGQRNRLVIRKDGTLARFEENVSVAAEGATDKAPVIAIGDLPREVQDTIRRQTDTVRIEEISSTEVDGNTVYQVKWQTNGAPAELMVATDGAVIYPTGTPLNEAAGEKVSPVIPSEDEEEVEKVVDISNNPADSTGAPAATNSGSGKSTEQLPASTLVETNAIELKTVELDEVPDGVRNTVKKLTASATLESISPKIEATGVVYEVTFMQNGERRKMILDKDGSLHAEEEK